MGKAGDEVMEYVPPFAWRNCWQGKDNHGNRCSGTGMIVDPAYNHRNVLWVLRQKKKVWIPKSERQSGCDLNLGSSIIPAGQGVWDFRNITFWMEKYEMELVGHLLQATLHQRSGEHPLPVQLLSGSKYFVWLLGWGSQFTWSDRWARV